MGHKAAETTHKFNNASDAGTVHQRTGRWFNRVCKGHGGWMWEADSDQLGAGVRADPLTVTREGARELSANHATVLWP